MSTITFESGYVNRATRVGIWLILAIALHIAIVGLFIWNTHNVRWDESLPAPSVVMELSIEAQAEKLTEVNIGQVQELSVASESHQAQAEEVDLPALPKNDQAEVLVTQTVNKKPKPEVKKQKREQQPTEEKVQTTDSKAHDSPVTSDAAAPLKSHQIAAEFNSQSQSEDDARKQWEAQVLGKLNKYKRYPEDAGRRSRVGKPVVIFTVDPQGILLDSELMTSSGTRSLDREAQQVLSRAAPLPLPPSEILKNGRVTVRMPIDFTLNEK
ncbi:TonB family protein [Providencia rustigianii]|uniref:TonB family protein n=1 Tax=Providencia rustigianii TaxID=158850 RepID=UPI000F700C48|nr:energy transducer TonB [Providencia rustigianii]MTC59165.1 TonB family protein [Providencia rustigianii]VEH55645.1 transport protein TonB [Providencia rustigianii]